jgi:hypothetical protein
MQPGRKLPQVVMTILHGISRKEGIAIAVAAIVDTQHGISGVSPTLLKEGLEAIKRMLDPTDYPECVLVCDNLATGLSAQIPGINIIGIAAQSETDVPIFEPQVPCVMGLTNLLRSVSHGDILILDAHKGILYIDPDPRTLMHYQEIEERHASKPPIYIESAHMPARTQNGVTIDVYAYVENAAGLAKALEGGADGLIIGTPKEPETGYYANILTAAVGKHVAFAAQQVDADLLRAVMKFALPIQVVSVLLPAAEYDSRAKEAQTIMESVEIEAFLNDLDPPNVALGILTEKADPKQAKIMDEPAILAVDLRGSAYLISRSDELRETVHAWVKDKDAKNVIILLGNNLPAITTVVEAGARSVAVSPDLVSECKYIIRSIGLEDAL